MVTRGPVVVTDAFEPVTDVDEEIFILYSELQRNSGNDTTAGFRGLGYVDSHKDILEIKFVIKDALPPSTPVAAPSKRRHTKVPKAVRASEKTVEIELMQDKTALRSRKGDTGSVVWKASIDFAQMILQQFYSGSDSSLLDRENLHAYHVLELGAGTGLLSVALSPLVRYYTATDIAPLIPLIRKNVAHNFPISSGAQLKASEKRSNISVEELDWIAVESASPSQRTKIYNTAERPIDLLLVVDCLYHPVLIPPFLATIEHLAIPGRTAVLIVSELRAEDVMRDFIQGWLEIPGWEIWRIPNDDLGKNYVIWHGWKAVDI
ncbi:hypothetical protein HYPSUDRAFT_205657 [Hypholoma sublateritium FD-334 SS-4]|uniref:Uncharacterized protein n=1 Tax=Hypholoma sublateritium (strain FD-334 SS-4) TaxID=945553 RepID=A0A0D2NGD2_HYPSF|nr:hypothetical protein HYPSUDRAFT_205657 [Hypholoma sublateritium FD-334 SS-4]